MNLDLDLLRLRLFLLGEVEGEYTVLELRFDAVRFDMVRDLEGPVEAAVNPFTNVNVTVILLALRMLFPRDGQDVVLHLDLDVIALQPGEFGGDFEVIVQLGYFNPRRPVVQRRIFIAE